MAIELESVPDSENVIEFPPELAVTVPMLVWFSFALKVDSDVKVGAPVDTVKIKSDGPLTPLIFPQVSYAFGPANK